MKKYPLDFSHFIQEAKWVHIRWVYLGVLVISSALGVMEERQTLFLRRPLFSSLLHTNMNIWNLHFHYLFTVTLETLVSLTLLDKDLINIGQATGFFLCVCVCVFCFCFTNLILNIVPPLNCSFIRLLHSVCRFKLDCAYLGFCGTYCINLAF